MAVQARAVAEVDEIQQAIQRGRHREAAALCARQHGAALGRLCMAMLGSQAEAEEAIQDTLLAAHDQMGSYRAEGTVRSWLFGIARRVCARKIEKRITGERRLRLVHGASEGQTLPDVLVDVKRQADEVRAALARLSPTEREALLLRYEGDLSFKEIGEACGIDEATARKRASRGLDHLRALFKNSEG